jgi:hypothetical protein
MRTALSPHVAATFGAAMKDSAAEVVGEPQKGNNEPLRENAWDPG